MMSDSSADRDPLDHLAEEFVARHPGRRAAVAHRIRQPLPDRADEIHDLFPALIELEQLKPGTVDRTVIVRPSNPSRTTRAGSGSFASSGCRPRRDGGGLRGGARIARPARRPQASPGRSLADPQRLERFRREAKSAARLHHTNIVPVFGVGKADGRHFYAM